MNSNGWSDRLRIAGDGRDGGTSTGAATGSATTVLEAAGEGLASSRVLYLGCGPIPLVTVAATLH